MSKLGVAPVTNVKSRRSQSFWPALLVALATVMLATAGRQGAFLYAESGNTRKNCMLAPRQQLPGTMTVRLAPPILSSGRRTFAAGPAALPMLVMMAALIRRAEVVEHGSSKTSCRGTLLKETTPELVKTGRTSSKLSFGTVAMTLGFISWYSANVAFNLVNKQALGVFPHAWTVSVVQLAMVVVCSMFGWITGAIDLPWQSMGKGFLWRLLPAAACHALGNGLTSVAFACASVSFTHVVKTTEPVWMALGSFLMTGAVLPLPQVLSLIPIMLGVALATAGELSFTWPGFLAALGSTICFAGRGIFSKRLMSGASGTKKMSPLNVYAMDSLMALGFTVPMAMLLDGPSMMLETSRASFAANRSLIAYLLAVSGLSYYAYNAIAFKLLAKLDVVSHAVGNLGKRIFVIGFAVAVFNIPLTWNAVIGSAMAIAGSGLYSYVKATGGPKPIQPLPR